MEMHDESGCLAPDMPPEWLAGMRIIADDGSIEPCPCVVRRPVVVRA
jgi:hypothetical protein